MLPLNSHKNCPVGSCMFFPTTELNLGFGNGFFVILFYSFNIVSIDYIDEFHDNNYFSELFDNFDIDFSINDSDFNDFISDFIADFDDLIVTLMI